MVSDTPKILGSRKLDLMSKSCFCLAFIFGVDELLSFNGTSANFCLVPPVILGIRCYS